MRQIMTRLGLGLTLTVGATSVVLAQSTRPDSARPERSERGAKGDRGMRRGGPDGALLKGITLTDAQKTQLQALRKEQRTAMEKNRGQFSAVMKEAREARQKGDTATARARMSVVRTQMAQQREQHVASLRNILTAEQQKQFDANVTAWKERAPRGDRGDRSERIRGTRGTRGTHEGHGVRGGR